MANSFNFSWKELLRELRVAERVFLAILLCGFSAAPTYSQTAPAQEAFFMFGSSHSSDTFIFKLTDPARIQQARDIIANGTNKLVSGIIIKQPVYYNPPWSYHLDPKSIAFVDGAIELCDADMRYLENNLIEAYTSWCPWATRDLREIPPPAKPGAGNLNPAVSMTFPYADNKWQDAAVSSISLVANASDADGEIAKVEFVSAGRVIGEDTSYPYGFTWQNLAAGSFTVSATATDDVGAKTSSRSVTFLITPGSPKLLVDANTARGIALDSAILTKEPFPVISEHFFSPDRRTRLALFGHNLEPGPGEELSVLTAQAEDSLNRTYVLQVEGVGRVPDFPWLTQLIVKLPDELQGIGDVKIRVSRRGIPSNAVLIQIR